MIQLLRLREEVPLSTTREPYLASSFLCFCILWPAFAIASKPSPASPVKPASTP